MKVRSFVDFIIDNIRPNPTWLDSGMPLLDAPLDE